MNESSLSRKKRLAIISSHPIQYNAPLFRLLNSRGKIDVQVFYTLTPGAVKFDRDFGKQVEWDIPLLDGYSYTFVDNNGRDKKDFWNVKNPGLEKDILGWKADAVLVFGWSYLSHLRAMRYFKNKIPVFFRGDSTLLDEQAGIKTSIRRTVLSLIYRYADRFFYVGENNRKYFKACGVKDHQLIFAPHAIDNDRFKNAAEDFKKEVEQWRKAAGIAEDETIVLFAGKFQSKKNPLILMQSFLRVNPTKAHLVFTGDGILKRELEQLSQGNPRIHILPFQNQSRMPFIYALCDVFCLPSQGPNETWGLAVNEAMACGKAVLVSNKVGCSPDLVEPGVNGFVFNSGDADDLAHYLRLMIHRSKAIEMGRRSGEIISAWNFTRIAEEIENAIN